MGRSSLAPRIQLAALDIGTLGIALRPIATPVLPEPLFVLPLARGGVGVVPCLIGRQRAKPAAAFVIAALATLELLGAQGEAVSGAAHTGHSFKLGGHGWRPPMQQVSAIARQLSSVFSN